ncbi:sodium-dependent transporter bedraggled isoform X1 [Lutzomyia longipalpis]|uniref:sodium-dependent transporter bedraggled isoform X1 n=2 Tax=Lutzomyia longipalpis TaxID=7200 RepID=UPI002483E77C|nr:sodium-dependent transporter bedraggled isoform X1 [Lutzomyia longipalpis]XP_055693321.1 sodium-dependent transporter bedraggled isoform X1 [Lutzomyia longipalpis]XP_055693322.1 sodium-dependent transporter bedraggled isoform X1 [Lutzomyia longipalpis]XP_055693323.1 sodium-dependent transporter bedraggled isoform X1 [Lutzomyia longipalpis]
MGSIDSHTSYTEIRRQSLDEECVGQTNRWTLPRRRVLNVVDNEKIVGGFCTIGRHRGATEFPQSQQELLQTHVNTMQHSSSAQDTQGETFMTQSQSITETDQAVTPDIADTLMELDAYLEEVEQKCERQWEPGESSTSGATLPKVAGRRTTSLENVPRGHPYRCTIAFSPNRATSGPPGAEEQPERRWRRTSMRKTRPIVLPERHPTEETEMQETASTTVAAEGDLRDFLAYNSVRLTDTRDPVVVLREPQLCPVRPAPLPPTHSLPITPSHVALPTATEEQRPRQLGRRAEMQPRVVAINAESAGNPQIIVSHQRPNSAPARVPSTSEVSSVVTSRNPSPTASTISSSASSSIGSTAATPQRPRRSRSSSEEEDTQAQTGDTDDTHLDGGNRNTWPHNLSRALATLGCTLGLFNVSRFAIMSVHFGANFILQFLILSVIFGIPMLWLQMSLGAKMRAGCVSMWRISPISRGVGVTLLLVQGLVTLYSAVSVGWLLVYFRDSFVSRDDRYRWEEPFELFRGSVSNDSRLSDTVADYFSGVVLQRWHLGPAGRVGSTSGLGAVRFQVAFNLSIFWTLVFIVLCRGLRSYGKFVYVLAILPTLGITVLCTKLLTMIDFTSFQSIFPATDWQDFFMNSQSWMSAAQETFLTWCLAGASILTIYSRGTAPKSGGSSRDLRRDALLVALFTIYGLMMAALMGNSCVQILFNYGYLYFPGSYENIGTNVFLYPRDGPLLPPQIVSVPSKWLPRYSSVVGESFRRPGMVPSRESGYQVLRLVTELFPATLAAASRANISAVWSLLGFLVLLLFALAQLSAMWKPIAISLGESPSCVLLSCVTGLLLAIPLATESGISVIHFLDVILGGAWWLMLVWLAQLIAIFLIRGRPYSADLLVSDLHLTQTFSAFIAFAWNVLIPIGLIVLAIFEYKLSNAREFFHWRGTNYWPLWVRKVGGFLQVAIIQIIPVVAIIQIYRYITKGPPDILDRIQLLYRPEVDSGGRVRNFPSPEAQRPPTSPAAATTITLETHPNVQDDAPPKYTPPPSYTTATGARIAKLLRQSIRRSVRRILGESSGNRRQNEASPSRPPPDYSTVVVDPSGESGEMGPRVLYNSHTNRRSEPPPAATCQRLTAQDVAQLLRPRRTNFHRASSLGGCVEQVLRASLRHAQSRSVENLVLNAAPAGQSSCIDLDKSKSEDSFSVI